MVFLFLHGHPHAPFSDQIPYFLGEASKLVNFAFAHHLTFSQIFCEHELLVFPPEGPTFKMQKPGNSCYFSPFIISCIFQGNEHKHAAAGMRVGKEIEVNSKWQE